jgi:hypothetical protein
MPHMYTDEQIAGMQALLDRINRANRDKGLIRGAWIRFADIASEDWAKGLSRDDAFELARLTLEAGPWHILTRMPPDHSQPLRGAEFTDPDGYRQLYSS